MQECGFDFDTGCGNDFIMASFLKLFFIIAILGVRGGGVMLDLAGLTKIKLMKQSVIHSFYQTKSDSIKLVRKLLNGGSTCTCNQSVSQSKLQEVNPTVIQSVSRSVNRSFIQLRVGS